MKKSTLKFLAIAMFFLMGTYVMAQTQYSITFTVDMTDADPFDPATDELFMSGSFAGWAQPGSDPAFLMVPVEPGSMIYTHTATIDSGEVQYKYFRVIDGAASWDNGEWNGDPNRKIYIQGDALGDDAISNVWGNKPIVIEFTVNMTDADPFDPATDEVYISGNMYSPDWTQPGTFAPFKMSPVTDSAMYYRLNYTLYEGDYEYKYFRVINNEPSWNNGEWAEEINRTLKVDTATISKISDIWGDKPAGIFNEPNEFTYSMYPNPVLTILNIDNTTDVSQINVYDATGRMVRTVEVATASVTIDVADLQTGVYIVNVHNEKGMQSSKFIKN